MNGNARKHLRGRFHNATAVILLEIPRAENLLSMCRELWFDPHQTRGRSTHGWIHRDNRHVLCKETAGQELPGDVLPAGFPSAGYL
jgi:hypothetical protein